jgi:MFS family permease
MTSEAGAAADPVSRKSLLWLVAVGFFMQTLDATIINTALPAMAASLGESPLRMQSVVVAYALTMAMLIPASGWIADRFGTRRIFFCAIVLFAAGSVLCALSHGWGNWWPRGWCRGWAARCCCPWGASRCCARCRAGSSSRR